MFNMEVSPFLRVTFFILSFNLLVVTVFFITFTLHVAVAPLSVMIVTTIYLLEIFIPFKTILPPLNDAFNILLFDEVTLIILSLS